MDFPLNPTIQGHGKDLLMPDLDALAVFAREHKCYIAMYEDPTYYRQQSLDLYKLISEGRNGSERGYAFWKLQDGKPQMFVNWLAPKEDSGRFWARKFYPILEMHGKNGTVTISQVRIAVAVVGCVLTEEDTDDGMVMWIVTDSNGDSVGWVQTVDYDGDTTVLCTVYANNLEYNTAMLG